MVKPDIDQLAYVLNLSPYQRDVLKKNYRNYDISRLVVRGGALYAPRGGHGALWMRVRDVLRGGRADVIGVDKTLVRNRRGVRLYSGGNYSVNVGRHTFYADRYGQPISPDDFFNK